MNIRVKVGVVLGVTDAEKGNGTAAIELFILRLL